MRENKVFNGMPVTTDIPMLRDQTIYKFYVIRKEDKCNNTEIKVVAKLCNINYIEAKKKLIDKIVFIAEGGAYKMKELQQIASNCEVHYEISPPYQY